MAVFAWSGGTLTAAQRTALTQASTLDLVKNDSTHSGAGSVRWTYSITDSALDFLAAGEKLTVTYNVTLDDGHGGTVTQPVTVTVTGTDDAPVITTADPHAALTELAGTTDSSSPDSISGTLAFADVDLSETGHTTAVTNIAASGVTSGLAGNATLLGFLTTGTVTNAAGSSSGSIPWTFSAPDKTFDYLAVGETVTLTYTVQVTDASNKTGTQTVTVAVTGTDDAPVIVGDSTTPTGSLTEDAQGHGVGRERVSGMIAFHDVDLTDHHTVSKSVASFAWWGGTLTAAQLTALTSASTLTFVKSDSTGTGAGSVAWTYKVTESAITFLAVGETLTVTYTVTVDDGHGGTASQLVTVTIAGTNDAPTIVNRLDHGDGLAHRGCPGP